MSKTAFPTHVAVQNDAPRPNWRGYPDKFHRVGANHIAKGAHYTRKMTLARALKERWEPCRVCFRVQLAASEEVLAAKVRALKKLSDAELLERLPDDHLPAVRIPRVTFERVRRPRVVEVVLRRAGGHCERPGCSAELFETDDGAPYLEVHHLDLLADDGPDHPENAAALCPSCHRRLHSGGDRASLLPQLRAYVAKAQAAFVARAAGSESAPIAPPP